MESKSVNAERLPDQLRQSWARRQEWHDDPDTDAYRIFHGFTEGQPGLDVERFGPAARITWKNASAPPLQLLTDTLLKLHPFEVIGLKRGRAWNSNPEVLELHCLHGELPTAPIEARENGLRFAVEPFDHEIAGLFLDSRPAREWIRNHSRGRHVLNLFAYTGSLGVAAAAGGARSVTHLDGKKNPLRVARRNHEMNGLPIDDRSLLCGNVYAHLPRAIKSGRRFGAIILDPPPQLPAKKGRRPKGQDYPRLARLCAELLDPGGWLLTFFSRYDKSRAEYESDVLTASGGALEAIWRGCSGDDFPEADPEAKLRLTAWRRT